MEDYPRTLLELEERFATDAACRDYLAQLRWPDGFHCPACGHGKAWRTARGLYHCPRCDHQASVLAGTIFQDTHKPLRLWFRAIWHLTTQKYGANALGLQRVLGLGSYQTAWEWLHKLRRAMVRPGRERLSKAVEVDESYIGGERKGRRGRGAEGKALVVVAAEIDGPGIGRIRLRRVEDASRESLEPAVEAAVEPGSEVHTDGWGGYWGLRDLGYHHAVVRAEAQVGASPLPRVHRVASLLQRWLLGTYQGAASQRYLDYYLDEYTFRFNRRRSRSRGKLFYRLVQQAAAVDPVPGDAIVASGRGE
jgi:transposase-like protein